MNFDGIKLVEGSANYNIVATTLTQSQRQSLQTLELGEIIYVTDGTAPGIQVYNGSGWSNLSLVSATNTSVTPTGGISATNVQSALAELDTEKASASSLSTVAVSGLYADLSNKPDLALKADLVNGKVPSSQIPDSVLGQLEYQGVWDMSVAMLPAAPENKGHYYVANAAGNGYNVGDWAVSNGMTWDKVDNTDSVFSVNGYTGTVTITKTDIGLGNVNNTSDANKPISTAAQTALDLKANLAGALFTGNVGTSGTISDGIGNVRAIPQNLQSAAYTLVASDAGKHINLTTGGVTIPAGVFAIGDCIIIYNDSSTTQTITCTAVTAYVSGTNAVKSTVILAARGLATLMFNRLTDVVISGDVT